MTDVLMTMKPDGGDISIAAGRAALTDSFETACMLALFGGNEDDAGTDATASLQWWANLVEEDPARTLRSRTQHILRSLPLVPSNLLRIEDAVMVDLQFMVDGGFAESVSALVTMPASNTVRIGIDVLGNDGNLYQAQFLMNGNT